MLKVAALFLTVPLVACGQAETDAGPGGVTVGEARALDDAAEMIESRRLPDEVAAPGPAGAATATVAPSPAR